MMVVNYMIVQKIGQRPAKEATIHVFYETSTKMKM